MDDSISRQAVKELAHNQMREKYCGMALKKQRDFYIKLADSIIDLLPSAQPERQKGEWIDNETSYADGVRQTCTCSVCGIKSVRPLGNFCRWCGADMRGQQDE